MLDGKRVLFVGNSYTYYGKTVLEKKRSVRSREERSNDTGYFYQLCKENGTQVSVTNWTWGAHDLEDIFVHCDIPDCACADHLADLGDLCFDYVILQQGRTPNLTPDGFLSQIDGILPLFRSANPQVKFLFLVQTAIYFYNFAWESAIKELESRGITVVNWGRLVCDIINGHTQVPGAKQSYNKNSFIVCKSESDGYHPNMLTGYLVALMTYCAITGESALGQPYRFCLDRSLCSEYDTESFIRSCYCYQNATTNFPQILCSDADMKGLQQLADHYLGR